MDGILASASLRFTPGEVGSQQVALSRLFDSASGSLPVAGNVERLLVECSGKVDALQVKRSAQKVKVLKIEFDSGSVSHSVACKAWCLVIEWVGKVEKE